MPIMKKRDAAFNYGCLMAELKEKMVQFRSRMNRGDEEDQGKLVESKEDEEEEGEFKVIGKDSLISENELSFSLKGDSNSKILACPGERLNEGSISEMMTRSEMEIERVSMDMNEPRLELSGDSRMFPYPICFVSRSLPTPPKDYNLRKTGIDLEGSKYLSDEETGCNRVSRKLMFPEGEQKKEWSKFRKSDSKKDYYEHNLSECQALQEFVVTGGEKSSSDGIDGDSRPASLNCQARPDYNRERKVGDLSVLKLPQVIYNSQMAGDNPNQRKEKTGTVVLLQNNQSLDNIKSFQENIPSKCKNSQFPQFLSLSRLVKDDNVSSKTSNNCSQYKTIVMATKSNSSNEGGEKSTNEKHPGFFPVSKKKNHLAHERGNVITTRYYKMASQLRVIY